MKQFEVDPYDGKIQSINRTIRLKAELYDKLTLLSEKSGLSLNKVINQCVAYALDNMKDPIE